MGIRRAVVGCLVFGVIASCSEQNVERVEPPVAPEEHVERVEPRVAPPEQHIDPAAASDALRAAESPSASTYQVALQADSEPGHPYKLVDPPVRRVAPVTARSEIARFGERATAIAVIQCTGATFQRTAEPPFVSTTLSLRTIRNIKGRAPATITRPGGTLPDRIVIGGEDAPLQVGPTYLAFFFGKQGERAELVFAPQMPDPDHLMLRNELVPVSSILEIVKTGGQQ